MDKTFRGIGSFLSKTTLAAMGLLTTTSGLLQAQTKVVSLSPPTLVFPVTVKGKTSAPETITVTSTGNDTVTFTGFSISGANATDFAITANTCGATLPSASSCQVSITLTPAAFGSQNARLNISDDASGSPQTVNILGSGANIVFTLQPGGVTFPLVTVGSSSAPVTITATNIGLASATISSIAMGGGDPTDFAIGTNTCGATLAAGASCTVNVTFTPQANGIRTANLLFADNAAGTPQSVQLTGTAQGATQSLIFAPTSIVFNPVSTGSQYTASTVVTNYGSTTTNFTGVTITGSNPSDFGVLNSCLPLAVGAQCTIGVTFQPLASGVRTAILLVTDSAAGSPHSVPLVGTGIAGIPQLSLSPTGVSFAPQNLATSATSYIAVNNYGPSGATFSSFALSGKNAADFSITSNSCPTGSLLLAPQQTCTLGVTFTPAAAGIRTASLTITDSAMGSPQIISLNGTGQSLTKQLSFSTGSLSFGAQGVGTSTGGNTVTVQSAGAGTVTLTRVSLSGTNAADFTITNSSCLPGTTLGAFQQCYVQMSFTPSATGVRTATLTFTDDAKGSPQTITLEGVGETTTQQLSFSFVNLDLGIQDVGSTSTEFGLSVSNLGDSPVTFTSISISGTNASDFSLTYDSCIPSNPLQPGSNCVINVAFDPSATGVRSAQLAFQDSATGSPQTVGLSGMGQAISKTASFQLPSLVFPAQTVSTSGAALSESFSNTGDAPVVISSIAITGGNSSNFTVSSNQCPVGGAGVAPGGSCSVSVAFAPGVTGLLSSTLQFVDSGRGSPHNVPLVGVGEPAVMPLTFNPSDVGFNDQNIGSTSSTVNVSVSNPGSSSVSETVALAGANAGDFSITANNCPASIGAGSNCMISVNFKPTGAGLRVAVLQFNASGSTLDVGLSGVGTTGSKVLATQQNTVDFGVVNVTSTSNQFPVAITNTGTNTITFSAFSLGGANPGDFTIAANQCGSSVSVGASCAVYLTFTPGAPGVRTGTFGITDDAAGSPQRVPLSGIGQTATKVLDLPQALAFPATNLGFNTSLAVYVYDVGTDNVTLSNVSITGVDAADFSFIQSFCSAGGLIVTPGGYCVFTVTFAPIATGTRTAALQFTDDATGSPQSIALTGFAQTPVKTLFVPQAATVPVTAVGTTNNNGYVYVSNSGNATVTFTSLAITGANMSDFAISSTGCSGQLFPGSSCYTYISFTPSANGLRVAKLQFMDDATGSPQTVTLSGVGQASTKMLLFPPAAVFPDTTLGSTAQNYNINVYNAGTAAVTITGVAITGTNAAEFGVISANCGTGSTVAPGSNCYFYVTFTPTASGLRTAALQLTDDAAGGTQTIVLDGVGQEITDTASITPGLLAFGATAVGTSGSSLLTYLYNTGTALISISTIAVTGTNASDFSITSSSCSAGGQLSPGSGCYIYVAFTPGAVGPRSASLVITDNAVGGTQSAALTGTGQ